MNKKTKNLIALGTTGVLASLATASAALPSGLSTALADAEADALAAIALGGAMLLVIAIGGLAWRVASKYIKRAGGAA